MEKNDFMFVNILYLLTYKPPTSQGPVVVNLNSIPLPSMNLDSLPKSSMPGSHEQEDNGLQTSTNPGVEGINKFGTNTFQIHRWMVVSVVRPIL